MKKMIISIITIILAFGLLIGGIVLYIYIENNPPIEEKKAVTMPLDIEKLSIEKKLDGEAKVDITDIIVEEHTITVYTKFDFTLDVYRDLSLKAVHDHEENTTNEGEMGMAPAICYFEVVDQNGDILNNSELTMLELNEKDLGFAIFSEQPEEGSIVTIKLYEKTTNTLLGEKRVEIVGLKK